MSAIDNDTRVLERLWALHQDDQIGTGVREYLSDAFDAALRDVTGCEADSTLIRGFIDSGQDVPEAIQRWQGYLHADTMGRRARIVRAWEHPHLPADVTVVDGFQHLIGFSKDGRAVVVVGDDNDPNSLDLTEEIYEAIVAEWELASKIQAAPSGFFRDEYVVFSRYNLFGTDDVTWVQLP